MNIPDPLLETLQRDAARWRIVSALRPWLTEIIDLRLARAKSPDVLPMFENGEPVRPL